MKTPSKPINPETVQKIKDLLAADTYHQHQIAAIVGVNQGRVSEVKHGIYG